MNIYSTRKPLPFGLSSVAYFRTSLLDMSEDGTIKIKLESGTYHVELRHQPTPAFKIGIFLSIFSLLILIFYCLKPDLFQLIIVMPSKIIKELKSHEKQCD